MTDDQRARMLEAAQRMRFDAPPREFWRYLGYVTEIIACAGRADKSIAITESLSTRCVRNSREIARRF